MTLAATGRAALRLVRIACLLLLLCGAWTAWALLDVRDDVSAARTALETATGASRSAEGSRADLRQAIDRLDLVERRLGAPGPALIGVLPLVDAPPAPSGSAGRRCGPR